MSRAGTAKAPHEDAKFTFTGRAKLTKPVAEDEQPVEVLVSEASASGE